MYIMDQNMLLRKVDINTGSITTVAGINGAQRDTDGYVLQERISRGK